MLEISNSALCLECKTSLILHKNTNMLECISCGELYYFDFIHLKYFCEDCFSPYFVGLYGKYSSTSTIFCSNKNCNRWGIIPQYNKEEVIITYKGYYFLVFKDNKYYRVSCYFDYKNRLYLSNKILPSKLKFIKFFNEIRKIKG